MEVISQAIIEAVDCKKPGCELQNLESLLYDFGHDLRRVRKNEKCTAVARGLQRIVDSRNRVKSKAVLREYVACIRRSVAKLDDGRSRAEVIARALRASCVV